VRQVTDDKPGKKPRGTLQLLERSLALISIVAQSDTPLNLKEISLRAGLSPSTTHRLLWSLNEKGWLTRRQRGRWDLGGELLALGLCARNRFPLPLPQDPVLLDLSTKTNAQVFLCLRHADTVLPIETRSLNPMPLHACSAGCVLLAQLDSTDLAHYFERNPQSASTREALLITLERARQFGWLQSTDDVPGKTLVSAPVPSPEGAVSCLNLLFDTEGQVSPEELSALLAAAKGIGQVLP